MADGAGWGMPLRSFSEHILCSSEGYPQISQSCEIWDSKPLQGHTPTSTSVIVKFIRLESLLKE